MQDIISGLQNPLVKKVKRLIEKSSARKEEQLFVVEGVRECSLLLQAGYQIEQLLVCEDLYKPSKEYPIALENNTRYLTKEVYESLAYRESTEGIIAVARQRENTLSSLELSAKPLVLVLAGIEKPGNIGAMLRTCDAVNVEAVILCNTGADIYNPNVIRSSLGTVFTNSIAVSKWSDVAAFFAQHGIASYAAKLGAPKRHFECNFNQPCAIVMGAEAKGLPAEILEGCTEHLMIPMNGKIDSLNVSVSAGVLLYEAVRQRS